MNKKLASVFLSSSFILNPVVCQNHNLFCPRSYCLKVQKDYNYQEISDILNKLSDVISTESCFFEKESRPNQNIYIIGDLHGNYSSFDFVRNRICEEPNALFIFLGDYVDRGLNSIEVFMGLAELKIQNPENIILLSGNHEYDNDIIFNGHDLLRNILKEKFPDIIEVRDEIVTEDENLQNQSYLGMAYNFFKNMIFGRPEPETRQVTVTTDMSAPLYNKFCEVFKKLPLAVNLKVNDKKFFCVHGGIPVYANNKIDVLSIKHTNTDELFTELLWNDPNRRGQNIGYNNRYLPNSYKYTSNHVDKFLKINNVDCIFRAHEEVENGFSDDFGDHKHFTIFSSANYLEVNPRSKTKKFDASIVKINPDGSSMEVIRFGGDLRNINSDKLPDYKITNIEKLFLD